MSVITITIEDKGDEVTMTGNVDPTVLDAPPTAALIVASYIAAHAEEIVNNAGKWFLETARADANTTEAEGPDAA